MFTRVNMVSRDTMEKARAYGKIRGNDRYHGNKIRVSTWKHGIKKFATEKLLSVVTWVTMVKSMVSWDTTEKVLSNVPRGTYTSVYIYTVNPLFCPCSPG